MIIHVATVAISNGLKLLELAPSCSSARRRLAQAPEHRGARGGGLASLSWTPDERWIRWAYGAGGRQEGGGRTRKAKLQRRRFTDEFKAGAVRLVLDGSKTIAEVARDLDLTASALGLGSSGRESIAQRARRAHSEERTRGAFHPTFTPHERCDSSLVFTPARAVTQIRRAFALATIVARSATMPVISAELRRNERRAADIGKKPEKTPTPEATGPPTLRKRPSVTRVVANSHQFN